MVGPAGHVLLRQALEVGPLRPVAAGRADRGERRVADGGVVPVAVAPVEGDDHVGADLVDRAADLVRQGVGCSATKLQPAERPPCRSRGGRAAPTRPTPSTAAAACSSSGRGPWPGCGRRGEAGCALAGFAAVLQQIADSAPRSAAWASTDPQPNDSSSGWATTTSTRGALIPAAVITCSMMQHALAAAGSRGICARPVVAFGSWLSSPHDQPADPPGDLSATSTTRGSARRSRRRTGAASCPRSSCGSPQTTGRCGSGSRRPTRSRRRSPTCSRCSTYAKGSGSSTSAPGRAGPPRCSAGSSVLAVAWSASSWSRSSPAAVRNLARHDLPWATIDVAEPGVYGRPAAGPYDRILVSAEAHDLPDELVRQLAPGGRMVVPVRHRMLVVDRREGRLDPRRPPRPLCVRPPAAQAALSGVSGRRARQPRDQPSLPEVLQAVADDRDQPCRTR